MLRRLRLPVPLWALATLCSGSLHAQATVTGTVTDRSTGLPVADAQVFFGNRTTPAVTNAFGKYRIADVPAGRDWVMVRRIGYTPLRRTLLISGDSAHTVHIGLDPLPVTLPEIEVRAESGFQVRRLQDFWHRYQRSWGRFVTHDQLQLTIRLSTAVRTYLPFTPVERSDVDAYYAGNANARGCPPAISINGNTPWRADRYVDDFPPSTVEVMEVYKSGARIPIEFQIYDQAYACGLVVLWLR